MINAQKILSFSTFRCFTNWKDDDFILSNNFLSKLLFVECCHVRCDKIENIHLERRKRKIRRKDVEEKKRNNHSPSSTNVVEELKIIFIKYYPDKIELDGVRRIHLNFHKSVCPLFIFVFVFL